MAVTAILFSCHSEKSKNKTADKEIADEIRAEFKRSWQAYKTYAWGHDALLPVSKGYKDVRTKEQNDHMETFFLAKTLKYLCLVFANPEGINPDDCVFSTEAHPFRK